LNPAILLSVAGFAYVRQMCRFVICVKGAAATVLSLIPPSHLVIA
jgi:hypothetical protein